MEDRIIVKGLYRHFKGKFYRVLNICEHTETKEKMVYYQALYGNMNFYVRPYEMFASEVDKEKYPLVEQKYRFEFISHTDEETKDFNNFKKYYKEIGINSYYKVIKYLGNNELLVKEICDNEISYKILSNVSDLIDDSFILEVTENDIAKECPKLLFDY